MKKFNNFTLFNELINNYISQISSDVPKETLIKIIAWFNKLNNIIEYMLYTRFQPSVKKIKSTRNISGDLRQLLIKQGKIKLTPAEEQINLLEIIKYFKLLENFILTRKNRVNEVNDLNLSRFKSIALECYDTLPKLLFEVEQSGSVIEKLSLTLLFSIIIVYRQFKVSAVFDSSTMTNEYSGTRTISDVLNSEFSHQNIYNWLNSIENLEDIKPHIKLLLYCGNAASPSGGASGINLLNDVLAIARDSRLWLAAHNLASNFEGYEVFSKLVNAINDNMLSHRIIDNEWVAIKRGDIDPELKLMHSKVFTFTAPGGKARIIAMADWVSQTALSAIHFSLFKLLTLLKSDTTFNHPSGLDLYQNSAQDFISVDLSAATDRIPKELQARILECLYNKLGYNGKSIADNWLELMSRDFSTKNSAFEKQTKSIRYTVGQGMGLFSSWTCLSITHHYIVNHLCQIDRDNYKLVGDDLLIRNGYDKYNIYLEFMQSIGMSINTQKTIISLKAPHTIEYARNYIINGHLIIPLPIGTAIAWLRGQVPTETLIWSHRLILNHNYLIKLIELLEGKVSHTKLLIMIYYFNKNNILHSEEINNLLSSNQKLSMFSIDTLNLIKDITKTDNNTWHLSGLGDFYSAVKSACVMRKDDELTKACILAESISLLRHVDDSLVGAANNLFLRLTSASLITYTPEITGGPITTRRERTLLLEYLASI